MPLELRSDVLGHVISLLYRASVSGRQSITSLSEIGGSSDDEPDPDQDVDHGQDERCPLGPGGEIDSDATVAQPLLDLLDLLLSGVDRRGYLGNLVNQTTSTFGRATQLANGRTLQDVDDLMDLFVGVSSRFPVS